AALQQADGSWPIFKDGPGNLSATIEAYFAMKLAGLSPDEPALTRARLHPRPRGARTCGRLHPHLARLVRAVPVGGRAVAADRERAPPTVVPGQHLCDVELGARDRRPARAHDGASRARPGRVAGDALGALAAPAYARRSPVRALARARDAPELLPRRRPRAEARWRGPVAAAPATRGRARDRVAPPPPRQQRRLAP